MPPCIVSVAAAAQASFAICATVLGGGGALTLHFLLMSLMRGCEDQYFPLQDFGIFAALILMYYIQPGKVCN